MEKGSGHKRMRNQYQIPNYNTRYFVIMSSLNLTMDIVSQRVASAVFWTTTNLKRLSFTLKIKNNLFIRWTFIFFLILNDKTVGILYRSIIFI